MKSMSSRISLKTVVAKMLSDKKCSLIDVSREHIKSSTRGGVEDTRIEAKDIKKSKAKAKDSLSEDRHSRGQGQECSRPRPRTKDTSVRALQKKKKVFTKIFQAISKKKGLHKNFSGDLHKKTFSKKFFKRSTKF